MEECEPCELATLTEEQLDNVDPEQLKEELEEKETHLKKLKPNLASIEAFKTKVSCQL